MTLDASAEIILLAVAIILCLGFVTADRRRK